jgi:FAD/FMN-containing dehydrogenase
VTQDVYSSLGNEISDFVYSKVLEINGSISAEHGIGLDKLGKLPLAKSKGVLSLSMDIKRLLDPYGILNPGRTIPFRQSDS